DRRSRHGAPGRRPIGQRSAGRRGILCFAARVYNRNYRILERAFRPDHPASCAVIPARPCRPGRATGGMESGTRQCWPPSQGAAMNLLELKHVSCHYGDFIAVEDISFTLQRGEMLALIGPNGAGKSTTFNMIGGQLAVTSGTIWLDGDAITNQSPRAIWR